MNVSLKRISQDCTMCHQDPAAYLQWYVKVLLNYMLEEKQGAKMCIFAQKRQLTLRLIHGCIVALI